MVAHSATLEINERVATYRREGRSILHLGFGEAGLPVLPELIERLRTAASDNRYGPVAGSEAARTAAAGYWDRRGIPTSPEQIMFAPGSKALLYATLAAVDGDVVLPSPSWVTYAAQAALVGKRVIAVPIPAGHGGVPDPDLLLPALRRARSEGAEPRIVVLTLPDNPTGTLAADETIRRICEIAEQQDLVILSDEIYRDLTHDGSGFTSPARYLPERTIVTSGLSKNLALGGWRIGFARLPEGPHGRRWGSVLRGVASEVWSSMSSPMESVAAFALDEPVVVTERITASRKLHGTVARAVALRFQEAGATLRSPQAGFYLYPDLEAFRPGLRRLGLHTPADVSRHLIDEHGLAVLPGTAFIDDPDALRFRVATSLLYGDDTQRLQALHSSDPLELPWIADALSRLESVLGSLPSPSA